MSFAKIRMLSSIRGRLNIGGVLVFLIAASAAVFALIRFNDSAEQLGEVTQQSLQTASHAREMDRAINLFASRVLDAFSADTFDDYQAAYDRYIKAWQMVVHHAGMIDGAQFDRVGYGRDPGLSALEDQLYRLDELMLGILEMDAAEETLFGELEDNLATLRSQSSQVKEEAGLDLSLTFADLLNQGRVTQDDLQRLVDEDFVNFQYSLEINVNVADILRILNGVPFLNTSDAVEAARDDFRRNLVLLERNVSTQSLPSEETSQTIAQLRRLGLGQFNLFDRRISHLELERDLAETRDVFLGNVIAFEVASRELSTVLVQRASDQIADVESSVTQSITATVSLLVIALASAFIVGWLVVNRGIVYPLARVETAMRAIAKGKTDVKLPESEASELDAMVAALHVLRTYVERVTSAEESLRQSQAELSHRNELLDGILSSLSQGVAAFDEKLRLKIWNEQYLSIRGYPGELVFDGQAFETLMHYDAAHDEFGPGDADDHVAREIAHASRFEPHDFERMRPNGTYVEVRGGPLPSGGFVTTYTDITARKASERQTQALLEAAPDAMLAITENGKIVLANARTEEVFGYPRDELVGHPLQTLLPPAVRDQHDQWIRDYMVDQDLRDRIRNRELTALHKDGHTFPAEVLLNLVETGERKLVVVAVRDITERKRVAKEIARRTEELQSAISGMPAGFLLLEEDLTVRIWNERYRDLIQLPDDIFDGQLSLQKIATAQFARGDFAEGEFATADDVIKYLTDVYCTDSYQSVERYWPSIERHVTVSSSPMPSGGWVVIYNDITERKLAETELLLARDAAEAATKAKDSFLAMMSHEIRTPMNGVVGMIDLLTKTKLDRDQRQMASTIRDSSFALLAIINDVLDFSKIEAGKMELDLTPISLPQIIDGVSETMGPNALQKGIRFVGYCDPDIPDPIIGDQVRMRQVLFNLVGNAVKFTTENRDVILRADLVTVDPGKTATVRYQVSDQGIGMSDDQIKELFKPFQQAEASTTRRFGGTGLGLSIVRRLLDMMGGEISVHSTPGEGTTFSVLITHEIADALHPEPELALSDIRVLGLVTSEEVRELILKRYLGAEGADVTILNNPDDLLPTAIRARQEGTPFDVIYLSVVWPEDVVSSLREAFRTHPDLYTTRFVVGRPTTGFGTHLELPDTTVMPATPLVRSNLVNAVAVSVGRASPNIRYGGDEEVVEHRKVPSIAEAEADNALILVVEDNLTNQDVISRQLHMLGYRCEMVDDGEQGLAAIRTGRYALVLSDVHMPNMDGFEMTAHVRADSGKDHATCPIIAITANALQGEAERCIAAGMDDYLDKPLEMKKLAAKLAHWLPHAAQNRSNNQAPKLPVEPETDEENTCSEDVPKRTLDVSALTDIFGDDQDTVKEILKEFVDPARENFDVLINASAHNDAAEVVAQSHKLKSSTKAIGAYQLSEFCQKIEKEGKLENWDEINVLLREASKEFKIVQKKIAEQAS